MDKFYFSKNNYTLISNIIREKLYKQYNYDINENSKFRHEIINIMNSIYEQKDLYNINFSKMDNTQSSLELTKKVLKTSYSYFSQYIEKTQNNPTLFEKKNVVDKRPEPSYVNNTNDVTKMYERLQTERNNVSINPNKDISFTENIEEENTNINKRYEEISSSRNNDYKNIVDEMNSNNDNLQFNQESQDIPISRDSSVHKQKNGLSHQPNSSIQEQFSQPSHQPNSSIGEQFSQQQQSSSIREQFSQQQQSSSIGEQFSQHPQSSSIGEQFSQHPQSSSIGEQFSQQQQNSPIGEQFSQQQQNSPIGEQFSQQQPNSSVRENNPSNLDNYYNTKIIKKEIVLDKKIRTYNLIINSINRDWQGKQTDDIGIIASNHQDRYDYKLNFSPDQTTSIKFNGTTQPIESSRGISIDRRLKNIVSIKLKRLIIPNYDNYIILNDRSIPTGSKSEPYLMISIDELNSNIITTNYESKNIFCKAHFDKEFRYNETLNGAKSAQTRGWIYYKNDDNDIVEFFPTPLTELTNLTIKILRPNGELYSNDKDNLIIEKITTVPENPSILKLDLNKFINNNNFKHGDKIIIKGLEIKDLEINNNLKDLKVHLENGVYIVDTRNLDELQENVPENFKNIKSIFINNKVIGIDDDGDNQYLDINPDEIKIEGFLINESLQHSMVLEVKVEEVI